MRRRAEFYYQQLDALRVLRQQVRRDLLAESKKHPAWKRLCQIPSMGPIRAAVLLGILQTPRRFRSKRPLWKYSGLAIETHSSADHRWVDGQLRRSKRGPATGKYRVLTDLTAVTVGRISRADVAAFMLGELQSDRYLRRTPALTY